MAAFARLEAYLKRVAAPCVAIFDIGTRACRLLVAPRTVPDGVVSKQTFFNDSDLSQLGSDVDKYHEVLPLRESHALERAVIFIRSYQQAMEHLGIAPEHILATGTAVFRWLKNKQEVIDYIRERTGVSIKVIPDRFEAKLSLAGICKSRGWRPGGPTIRKDDRILLLDQGCGSMEVSYISPDTAQLRVHSFDRLGTIALRNLFFTTSADGSRVSPESNRSGIAAQTKRITEDIDRIIRAWEGYPELNGRTLHAYAMGSAITDCYPNATNFEIHNQVCTIQRMGEIVDNTCSQFETTTQTVLTAYKALEGLKGKGTKGWENVENQLLTLYGLPVYIKVLQRFGLSEVRASGYGLRYGYYVWKYSYLQDDELGDNGDGEYVTEGGSESDQQTAVAKGHGSIADKPADALKGAAAEIADINRVAEAEHLIKEIENNLNVIVLQVLKRAHQNWWYELVPQTIREECVKLREKEQGQYPSEVYFYLLNLGEIIDKNWNLFEPGFRSTKAAKTKKEVMVQMSRLNELRNRRAHPEKQKYRPFTDADVAFLQHYYSLIVRLGETVGVGRQHD